MDKSIFNPNSFVDVATVGNIFVDLFVIGDLSTNPFMNLFSSNVLGSMTLNYEYTPVPEENPIVDVLEPVTIVGLVTVGAGLVASKGKKRLIFNYFNKSGGQFLPFFYSCILINLH